MRKKKKQKKSLHPPGGELLSAMPPLCAYTIWQAAPCGRGNPDCFVFRGGDAGGRENRSGDVSISVMIPIIPMLKRGCAFAEGKGFLERQCADSCDGP